MPNALPTAASAVLLTGTNRWASPARIAIELAKIGCRVHAACPPGHPLLYTRSVTQSFPYSSLHPLKSLRSAIYGSRPEFVIPCDDRAVHHLHELFAESAAQNDSTICQLIKRSLGEPKKFPTVSSRFHFLEIASEEGIRAPSTKAIRNEEDLKAWLTEQPFPWVLKADESFGGMGVRIAPNWEKAEKHLWRMSRPYRTSRVLKRLVVDLDPHMLRPWWNRRRPPIIAQAFIIGRPANCAVACSKGKVLAGIAAEVISTVSLTGPASVVRIVQSPEMMAAAEKVAARLELSGFFGLDFMIENQTNQLYLIELNPRCTPLCHLHLGKGRDLIAALYAELTGEPVRDIASVTENDLIAYFPAAWKHNRELLPSCYQDVPADEPDLVQALLRPWPRQTHLFRLGRAFTSAFSAEKSSAV
jgi:glutathione synthase/RimK-type ligase-like ATP-grasp enzyme